MNGIIHRARINSFQEFIHSFEVSCDYFRRPLSQQLLLLSQDLKPKASTSTQKGKSN